MTIGIIGLGLMGGSAALAIKAKRKDLQVWGMDRDAAVVQQALKAGAIDQPLQEEGLSRCQLVLLALYPQAAIRFLQEKGGLIAPGAAVVDFCGVKRPVVAAAAPLARQGGWAYVGGHPMAGREYAGFGYAQADLFEGASMILTPGEEADPALLKRLEVFFLSLGFGHIQYADPARHDRQIAYTSQLAHVVSGAYIRSPAAMDHKGFSGGSFRDMTRVARINDRMWTELFLDNRDFLSQEIRQLAGRLLEYADALDAGDACTLRRLLIEGNDQKERADAL